MRNSHWNIIKIIELESLVIQIESNIREYDRIKDIIKLHSEQRRELLGLQSQIELSIDLTKGKLNQILPAVRVKRGILNPLGSLIKLISGNLDNEDAVQYNKQISSLSNKEHSVENRLSIMQKAFDKLVNVSDDINFNVKYLSFKTKQLESLYKNETKLETLITIMNSLYQILHNLKTIYNIIQEIETAIAFSKLNTLHQSIINSTEFFNILQQVEKHANLIYPVTKENFSP